MFMENIAEERKDVFTSGLDGMKQARQQEGVPKASPSRIVTPNLNLPLGHWTSLPKAPGDQQLWEKHVSFMFMSTF